MAELASARASKGTCYYCKSEIEKGKMTQHLKYCKQRAATIATEAKASTEQKTRLFHLIVEGLWSPEYWMHLEIPASEPLVTLDSFLRGIWLECCGHLSALKIGDTSYSLEPDDLYYGLAEVGVYEEEEEEGEVGELDDVVNGEELVEQLSAEELELIPSDLLSELRKSWPIDELVAFLKERLKSLPREGGYRTLEEIEESRRLYWQRMFLKSLLDMVEDRSMYVQLGKVLKVGQKFSYDYDFGSTTHLGLKVASEREGVVRDEQRPIKVMARNNPHGFTCSVCGKPATKLASGFYGGKAYCNKCARKSGDTEMMLQVVNSPRAGVCGYTGPSNPAAWEDEDEEDER